MNRLAPSILAADLWNLGDQIRQLEQANIQYLHIDIMDGTFVPSISFGFPVLQSVRKKTDLFLDVHLMIDRPERYVEEFAKAGADLINFHIEATEDVPGTIKKIRATGKKVGITIKPDTETEAVIPYLDKVDMILVMTVEPGFGGQKLIPKCREKVKEVRRMVEERGLKTDIEVDGGITVDNIGEIVQAGANVIVAGSAVFKDDITKNVEALTRAADLHQKS